MRTHAFITMTLLTGLFAGGPAVAAPAASTTQSIIRLATQLADRSRTEIVDALAKAGFPHVCDVFHTSSRNAGDLKVCWSAGRWTATLRYPHAYGQPTFSQLARRISKKYGAPTREPRRFLVSPKVDVWPARRGLDRISLVRMVHSEVLEIRISGSTL